MAKQSADSGGALRAAGGLIANPSAQIVARVNGATSYTFSGLDTNSDEIYELQFWLDATGNANLVFQVNGDAGANYNSDYFYSQNGAALTIAQQAATTSGYMVIGGTGPQRFLGRSMFVPKVTTLARQMITHGSAIGPANIHSSCLGWYGNTSTTLTSLTVLVTTGTMTGTIILRKLLSPQSVPGAGLAVPLLGALPTQGLYDGMLIDFLADATNGVVWPLRYVAGEPGAYKWYARGATPLLSEVFAEDTTASTTYTALANAGPTITLPLAGDYQIGIGHHSYGSTGNTAYMSYDIGGTAASDNDATVAQEPGTTTYRYAAQRTMRKAGLGAVALTAKYRTTAGTSAWGRRWMSAVPIRVG